MLICNLSKYDSQGEFTPITQCLISSVAFLHRVHEPSSCGWELVYKLCPQSIKRNKKKGKIFFENIM